MAQQYHELTQTGDEVQEILNKAATFEERIAKLERIVGDIPEGSTFLLVNPNDTEE